MAGNKNLGTAKRQKKDEFYTQLSDIENELKHYKDFFKGKTVLCNCDDPFESNFFKFFAMNFNSLGLKKLITTCYAASPVAGNELELYIGTDEQLSFFPFKNAIPIKERHRAYKAEVTEVKDENGDGRIDLADVEYLLKNRKNSLILLDGDGDFRSPECAELLKEADIVVTNPPFSLFREYVAQLIKYGKKFIIIGNQNASHYKEIFPLIKENKIWLGYNRPAPKEFRIPTLAEDRSNVYIRDNGEVYAKFGNTIWFTNLDIEKRHEKLIIFKKYNQSEYPMYINYDAIDIKKTSDIPCDYWGKMGVPDNFLEHYNPEQFEIIGLAESELGKKIGFSSNLSEEECSNLFRENKSFRRGNPIYRKPDGTLQKPFSRIIIKRKVTEDENQTARNSNP